MTKIISLILCIFLCCRLAEAGMFNFTHTATLMLGQKEKNVLSQVEHVLMKPKDVIFYFEGEPDQIEARRYSFNEEYDIILFFGKDVFLGLDSIAPNSNVYPKLLHGFQSVQKQPSLRGYIITKTSNKLNMQVLSK